MKLVGFHLGQLFQVAWVTKLFPHLRIIHDIPYPKIPPRQPQFGRNYSPENWHGTWKSTLQKGTSFSEPPFLGSMLVFGIVFCRLKNEQHHPSHLIPQVGLYRTPPLNLWASQCVNTETPLFQATRFSVEVFTATTATTTAGNNKQHRTTLCNILLKETSTCWRVGTLCYVFVIIIQNLGTSVFGMLLLLERRNSMIIYQK